MTDYIEREGLINNICNEKCRSEYGHCQKGRHDDKIILCVCDFIRWQPAADVVPVRHGRWIIGEPDIIGVPIHCSECGWGSDRAYQKKWMEYPGHKFCGACGALMDRGQGND